MGLHPILWAMRLRLLYEEMEPACKERLAGEATCRFCANVTQQTILGEWRRLRKEGKIA